jgi:hypothetical protein
MNFYGAPRWQLLRATIPQPATLSLSNDLGQNLPADVG